nr:tRNA (N(6)-L-threonylcarbamoyladenosine(37)-C(2))-methylthiotransferase MtaB [Amaricoccus sp.]
DRAAVRELASRLRASGAERVRAHLAAMQGRRVELLMERADLGRTEGFAQTLVAGSHRPGSLLRATITGAREGLLLAEAA